PSPWRRPETARRCTDTPPRCTSSSTPTCADGPFTTATKHAGLEPHSGSAGRRLWLAKGDRLGFRIKEETRPVEVLASGHNRLLHQGSRQRCELAHCLDRVVEFLLTHVALAAPGFLHEAEHGGETPVEGP